MDSSGRTTQRQYDAGRGAWTPTLQNTEGCVRKARQPSPPIRGAQDGEEARAVAGELRSKGGGGKQETHAQHQVEELPWQWETLLDRFIQNPSWENSSELLPSACWPFGHTPQHRWQLQGTTVLKEKMLTMLGQKILRGQSCPTKKLKRSGHCALSIKERPLDWDPECQGAERQHGRDIIFRIFVPWTVGIFPQLFATVTIKGLLHDLQDAIHNNGCNQQPTPYCLRSRGSINCGVKYKCGQYRCI